MAITHVQHASLAVQSSANTIVVAATNPVGSGNGVVGAAGFSNSGGRTFGTVVDNQGNGYTVVDLGLEIEAEKLAVFYRFNITNGPTTITSNISGNVDWRIIAWDEFTELDSLDFIDGQTEVSPGTGTNGVNTTGQTSAVANELIWSVAANVWSGARPNAGTGFTSHGGKTISGLSIDTESKIQASTAAVEGLWTATANEQHVSMVVAVKPTGGGGGPAVNENSGIQHIECGSPMGRRSNGILHPIRHGIVGWRKGLIVPEKKLIRVTHTTKRAA